MVEQEAVNFEVAGSSPAVGAKKSRVPEALFFLAMKVKVLVSHGVISMMRGL